MTSLHFKGRVFVENLHLAVPYHELTPVRGKGLSKPVSLHDNLVVHGDNLAGLKALLPTYHGKVKCIYIDPPYNTGNEGWAYNDRVNSPMMKDWFGKVVDRDDLTRHDKWCCMMLPRLKLLRELLRDDGAIFVSIDDNEVHRLRSLMDEVFGEENFIATTIWQKVYAPKSSAKPLLRRSRLHSCLCQRQGSVAAQSSSSNGATGRCLQEPRQRPERPLAAQQPGGEESIQQGAVRHNLPQWARDRRATPRLLLARVGGTPPRVG